MSTILPPLTQLVGEPPVRGVFPPALTKPAAAGMVRQSVLRIKGSKDTTAKVLAALVRRKGKEGAVSAYSRSSEGVLSAVKYVIKTGIRSIDAATGGIPFSKVVEIYGLDACGKTALAMLACGAGAQGEIWELLPDGTETKLAVPFEVTILYLDNENSLQQGDRLMVYDQEVDCIAGECDTIDQIFKDVETCCDTIKAIQVVDEARAEKVEKLNKEALKKGLPLFEEPFIAPIQFLIVVVDTIAGTSTRGEVKQEWSKVDYKRQPAELRDGFRNTIRHLKEQNVCLICTNQVGDSFKPKPAGMKKIVTLLPQESDFNSFGGKALRYYAHLRIFVCKTPWPYKLAPGMFADGFVIHFFVAKNRLKMPLRSGRMVLMFKNALCQDQQTWANEIRPARIAEMVEREHGKGNKKFLTEDASKLFPEYPPGGLSPLWSMLEHLVYMRFIAQTATKGYKVNFAKFGIMTTTLLPPTSNLEELDAAAAGSENEFELTGKLEWPKFYADHKTEIDVLFDKAVEKMFAQNGVEQDAEADEMDLGPDEIESDPS